MSWSRLGRKNWRNLLRRCSMEDLIVSFMMEFVVHVMAEYMSSWCIREIGTVHNSTLQRNVWLMEKLNNSSPLGMVDSQAYKQVFISFCDELKAKRYLIDSRYISVYEQVVMSLLKIGHNWCRFLVRHFFQLSSETVTRHFRANLHALTAFSKEMIKPPSFDEMPPKILKNMK